MPQRCFLSLASTVVLCLSATVSQAQQALTYPELVNRMTDLAGLAVLPAAGERCAQASSYERASKFDEKTGKYQAWGGNADGIGIVRREGKQIVMAEIEGPGCIWHIWTAKALQGHVSIYLDGQKTPVVDMPFNDYFTGDTVPFNYPMLSYDLAKLGCQGKNLYMPIPFQKSCKIVADEGWGVYYYFTYSTFPKGTTVPTFSKALVTEKDNAAALQKVNDFFKDKLGEDPAGNRAEQTSLSKSVTIEPGQTGLVAKLDGPRAITAIKVKMSFANREDQMAALRRLALRITWDDQQKPAVWCPLGDFFGTAPGENLYKSLVAGMTKDGYYAYWYMPFEKNAVVELVNEDKVARTVAVELVNAPLPRSFDGLGYFHAKWHRDTTELPKDRRPDWVMLQTQGRGRFCGTMLHVWNPRGGWWGEGDEKFFVDGEKFPSIFGTGSEDYFGYAWCDPGLFQRPYHCQTMTERNNGHQSLLRWHIADNVPFETSFEGCIEKYDHPDPNVQYANTVFWYLSPNGVDPYEPVPVANRDGYYDRPVYSLAGIKVLEGTAGDISKRDTRKFKAGKWEDDDQLQWRRILSGDRLTVALPVKTAGKHQIKAGLTKGPNYAIVQFYLNGKKVGDPIDLYNAPEVIPFPVSLGVHELTAGEHRLTVEMVGTNKKASKSYIFGLDSLKCEPVE